MTHPKATHIKICSWISFICISMALLVLVGGWGFNIALLKSVHPQWVSMKANTALGFLFAGLSLWLLSMSYLKTSRSLAIAIIALGVLTLAQYAFGVDLGIDQLLFLETDNLVDTSHPGRPSPQTALNFVIIGLSLCLISKKNERSIERAQMLALASSLMSFTALIGYLYGATSLHGIGQFTHVAAHTTLLFLLVAFGIFSLRPDHGVISSFFARRPGGFLLRKVVPVVIVVPIIFGFSKIILQETGRIDQYTATALLVIINVLVMLVAIWLSSKKLDQIDTEKEIARDVLKRTLEGLENQVAHRTQALSRANQELQSQARALHLANAINTLLIHSPPTKVAIHNLLAVICSHLGWSYGAFWEPDTQSNVLRQTTSWSNTLGDISEFEAISKAITFAPGVGLPGRIWVDRKPHWVRDVTEDKNFPRAQYAKKSGIYGAFGFSIEIGDRFFGVLEFFSSEIEEPSQELLSLSLDVSAKIGSYIQRKKLEETVTEQQSKLIYSSKMSALGEMAGGIAHEINTPLSVISLSAGQIKEMIEEKRADLSYILKASATIEKTTHRIATIIKGLRFFAREGSQDGFELTSIKSLIDDTLSLCEEGFRHKGISVKKQDIPDDLKIECRSIQISQVLLNLFNNSKDAIQDLDDQWVKIDVIDQGDSLTIAVTDSGGGIPSHLADKIMQPFYTTKAVGKGTGLGLSLSKGIIEDHQGNLNIDLQSKNTCFLITLPKKQAMKNQAAA